MGLASAGALTLGSSATVGLIGAGGAMNLAAGSLTGGLFSGGWGTVLGIASLGTSAYGQYSQGKITAANLQYQVDMAEYNRQVGENNAIVAEQAAEYEADAYDYERRKILSMQGPRYAKGGVVINKDTPLDLAAATETKAQQDRLAILYRGKTQADAYRAQAAGQQAAARNYQAQIGPAITASRIATFGEVAKGGYRLYRGAGTSLLS